MSTIIKCEFCETELSSKYNLKLHQEKAKYCLKIQGKSIKEINCEYCNFVFSRKSVYENHKNICKVKKNREIICLTGHSVSMKEEIILLKSQLNNNLEKYNSQIYNYEKQIKKQQEQIQDLQNKLENIAIKAVSKNFENEATIRIESKDKVEDVTEEYDSKPLLIGDDCNIENRDEDGYINVTSLCKAGGKEFSHWKANDRTKEFLKMLSSSVGIPTDELIKYDIDSYGKKEWVHPQVAINIAQWISPHFDIKVSSWIYEIMMTGTVDITNTKPYKQLQQENKDKQLKIQILTKKYVKKVTREKFKETNVIYIVTTDRLEKDGIYILGKAENLTNRLSVYNKSDDHKVIYHQQCNGSSMSVVENMVFNQLEEYRQSANRERFVLPKDLKIDMFVDVIKKSIGFFSK